MNSVAPDQAGPPISEPDAPPISRGQRLLRWIKGHKIKTFLLLILALILFELATIPFFGVASLKSENPEQTALMRQRLSEAEHEGKKLKITQRWVPLSRISRHLVNAVIVAEDGTFYSHNGFDWYEVQESIEKNIDKRRAVRGASTITQQLAKNLYLSTSKDPIRKLKEAIITLLLENSLSKNRILEIYLNVIEWGRGVFGVEAAAQTYFGKSAASLTLEEATRMAAVIPSPLRHRPDEDTRYVLRRQQIVLRRMSARNFTGSPTTEETQSKPDLEELLMPDDTSEANMPVDTTDVEEENNGL